MKKRLGKHDAAVRLADAADDAPAPLDDDACYRAISSRDRRFDGKFFTAVRTTGIYCRPVCPAQTPKRVNVRFFVAPAAAEAAGFRPCLRCRPEAAPGTPAWLGTSATVARALRLIDAGGLDDAAVEQLAARVGIGERHLRRLFVTHVGAAPVAVAQTRRVQLAKQLLDETKLPVARIAMDAGFGSLRRFNFAMRATYGRNPSELRRQKAAQTDNGGGKQKGRRKQCADAETNGMLALKLAYRPPFAWDDVLAFLALRATPGIEKVVDGTYLRRVRCGRSSPLVRVDHDAAGARVVVSIPAELSSALPQILACVRRTFDLSADPQTIARTLGADPALAPSVKRRPGIRVPGAWDPFDVAVRAVVGQQISVRGATTIMGRIAERYGTSHAEPGAEPHLLFPPPETLADADLSWVGMPTARAAAINALARAVAAGDVALDGSRPLADSITQLESLPGIGAWTAAYIAMRALGEPDAFPAGDLVVRRALAQKHGEPPSIAEVVVRAEQWRPWRAYATVHLWAAQTAEMRGAARRRDRTKKPRKPKEVSRATAA